MPRLPRGDGAKSAVSEPMFLPAFDRHPTEAAFIGRLLAGYGSLEFSVGRCLASALDDAHTAFRTLYRVRGEEQRLLIADALMRPVYKKADLGNTYSEAIADAGWCRAIRNQYAHCHWLDFDDTPDALYFVELEDGAKKHGDVPIKAKLVSVDLLKAQDKYFMYVSLCLSYLEGTLRTLVGKPPSYKISLPKKLDRPPLDSGEVR